MAARPIVIIYDDNQDLLEMCSMVLSTIEVEIVTRTNCNTIMVDLEQFQPAAVLMDNHIGPYSGVTAVKQIKASDFRNTCTILFSANFHIKALADEAGADYYLEKPFNIHELRNIVLTCIGVNC
ncbi:MAG: response regulator transcription factor [Chitinophagaceae bacterium]|nr:MAG: response regulator transcription factor [Chitinophagaceae bacterium]